MRSVAVPAVAVAYSSAMLRITGFFGILALSLCGAVHSAPHLALSASETRSMLLSGDFSNLDRRFGDTQRAYRNARISEEDLRAAFRVFYDADPALESAYKRWLAQSPKSYVAHLASGIYYKQLGIVRRGDESASRTSEKEFAAMRAAHSVASQEFTISLELDPKPILTYVHFMDIYLYAGDKQKMRQLFETGLRLDPKSFILREKYISAKLSRWGGSTAQTRAFVEECRGAGLSQSQMARLNALVHDDEAWVRQFQNGDLDAAAESYRAAALLNPNGSCAECSYDFRRAEILYTQKQYAKAVDLLSPVLKQFPDDVAALKLRADCNIALRKGGEASADLMLAANKGDPEAQTELAKLLLVGDLVPENRQKAIKLLTRAANQNYPEAVELVSLALNPDQKFKVKPREGG
jgi:tetratricopeptide (TPR) repeat protein